MKNISFKDHSDTHFDLSIFPTKTKIPYYKKKRNVHSINLTIYEK